MSFPENVCDFTTCIVCVCPMSTWLLCVKIWDVMLKGHFSVDVT